MSNQGLLEQHYKVFWNAGRSFLCAKEVKPLLDLMLFWEKEHGTEWLINRMKLMELLFLGKRNNSISCNSSGAPKGHFGNLYRKFTNGPKRTKSRTIRFLRLHGLFNAKINKHVYLSEQARLAMDAETSELCHIEAQARIPLRSYVQFIPSGRYPMYEGTEVFHKTCHDDHIKALRLCPSIVRKFPSLFAPLLGIPLFSFVGDGDTVGNCAILTKDGSLKTRLVYSPFMILQMALYPLYQDLYQYASTLPSMYHLNQEAGKVATYLMLLNFDVGSVDLKAASDYIPLEPQLALLKSIFPYRGLEIDLFGEISRGSWRTPYPDIKISIKIGQPMGINVSFLSFSIYLYHLLKDELSSEEDFAMVGDDLVVKSSSKVINLMQNLNIPLSLNKCIVGSYAQFCGSVISRYHGDLHTYKCRSSKYFTWVAAFGKAIMPSVPKSRRFLYFLAQFPPPVGVGLKPGTLDLLPPSLLWSMFTPKDVMKVPLVKHPTEDAARYVHGVFDAVEIAESVPGMSMEQATSVLDLTSYIPYGPRYYSVERKFNWLAESANSLFKDEYPVEFVVNHLRILGNLFHFPEFTLPLSVITDDSNRSMGASNYYRSYKRLRDFNQHYRRRTMTNKRDIKKKKSKAVTASKAKPDISIPKKSVIPEWATGGFMFSTSVKSGTKPGPTDVQDLWSSGRPNMALDVPNRKLFAWNDNMVIYGHSDYIDSCSQGDTRACDSLLMFTS